MFKIKSHVAVLWRNVNSSQSHYDLLSPLEWREIQLQVKAGIVVIMEAWTLGKCISN